VNDIQLLHKVFPECQSKKNLQIDESNNGHHPETSIGFASPDQPTAFRIGDLCPECGQAAVVNEEGCRKCYACGYSEC